MNSERNTPTSSPVKAEAIRRPVNSRPSTTPPIVCIIATINANMPEPIAYFLPAAAILTYNGLGSGLRNKAIVLNGMFMIVEVEFIYNCLSKTVAVYSRCSDSQDLTEALGRR